MRYLVVVIAAWVLITVDLTFIGHYTIYSASIAAGMLYLVGHVCACIAMGIVMGQWAAMREHEDDIKKYGRF